MSDQTQPTQAEIYESCYKELFEALPEVTKAQVLSVIGKDELPVPPEVARFIDRVIAKAEGLESDTKAPEVLKNNKKDVDIPPSPVQA
jgi:hypothetical protein